MKTRIQVVLLITAALFGAWGVGLVFAPEYSQRLISNEPYNSVLARMLGASFLGWVVACVIAARNPGRDIVRAVGIGVLFVAAVAVVQMFVFHTMPVRDTNLVSLVVALGAVAYLLFAEWLIDTTRAARKRAAGRKTGRRTRRAATPSRARAGSRKAGPAGRRRRKKAPARKTS